MENRKVDMICQLNKDETIIPMKMRLVDEDGMLQEFQIRGYRIVNTDGDYKLPSGLHVSSNGMFQLYECKILILGRERVVRLIFNKRNLIWMLE